MPIRDRWRTAHHSSEHVLARLMEGNPGLEIDAGSFRLRIGDVPLFRQGSDGLAQVIRVAIQGELPSAVTIRVRSEGVVHDERRVASNGTRQPVHLFVPEVTTETPFLVELVRDEGEPITAQVVVAPQRKWSVHLIHHSHYDIGYTDPQATVIASQLGFLDSALDLVAATDDWPDDARFRWVIEVTDPLKRWLAARPAEMHRELFRRVAEGRMEVNGLPFTMHTEAYAMDEIAHQMHAIGDWRERYGITIDSAMQSDVPGAATGLATLLANAGIKYLSVAHNYAGRSVPHLTGGQALTRPFYWQAPDGNRVLTWMTDSTFGMAYMEGNHAGLATGYDATLTRLPEFLAGVASRPYPYGRGAFNWSGTHEDFPITRQAYPFDVLHLRVQGVFADNAPPNLLISETVRRWNDTWAFPRLRMSTNRAFFEEIEAKHGDRIATFAGDWTDWWADGIGSAAGPLGRNRAAQADLKTALTLHALADATSESRDDRRAGETLAEADRLYDNLALFDEHTWGAANPWNDAASMADSGGLQWARKAAFAYEASEGTTALLEAGLHQMAHLATIAPDATGIAVINPSSWPRTDLVRVFVPESRLFGAATFAIMDEKTGSAVPFVVEPQPNSLNRPRGQWVTFLARDVPSLGYARYRLATNRGSGTSLAPDTTILMDSGTTIANDALRATIALEEPNVAELIDLASGRNLVDNAAPFGFNEYIYDVYATAPNFNHLSSRVSATDLAFLGSRSTARDGVVIDRQSNEVWDRLTVRSTGERLAWLETTYTLPHGIPRLDIANRMLKTATMAKESVYFAFPFAGADADLTYEITGALHGPDSPIVPGSAAHFRAIRHWIGIETSAGPPVVWATGEAPLVQTGTIHLPYVPYPSTVSPDRHHPGSIYSWAMNNMWDTNFPSQQGGELTFRYAVGVGTDRPLAAIGRETAAALTAPLLGVCSALRPASRPRPSSPSGSFWAVDHPLVSITHVAPSRRGHDLVVFVESLATEDVTTRVSFGELDVATASIGTVWERDGRAVFVDEGGVSVTISAGNTIALSVDLR